MFSRRKLFKMVGLGSAAVAASRLPVLAPSGPNQIEMLMAVKRELDNNPMSMLAAQQEINRRRSEMIRISNFKREYLREFAASPADKPYQRIMDFLA